MKLDIFKMLPASPSEFVEFWSRKYRDKFEDVYDLNIKDPFAEPAIIALFKWKNGSRLSSGKGSSVQKNFIARIDHTRMLPPNTTPAAFLEEFANGGAIWRIFWLHCWNQKYPIYDQHVHRAMRHIRNENCDELGKASDEEKVRLYLNEYTPFYRSFTEVEGRKVDKALWSLGKFLKTWSVST